MVLKKGIRIAIVVIVVLVALHYLTPVKVLSPSYWKGLVSRKPLDVTDKIAKACEWKKRSLESITDITVHHTLGPPTQSPQDIALFHINQRGWCGNAYHIMVYPDGSKYQVNDLTDISWHNGYNNAAAVGIVMVGNFDQGPPTQKQIDTTITEINRLKRELPNAKYVVGHNEVTPTGCPGEFVDMNMIRRKTNGIAR